MTRLEQQTFINDLMESFKRSMDADFMAGRIPPYWNGQGLRMYIADKVERGCAWRYTKSDRQMFERDCLIYNL